MNNQNNINNSINNFNYLTESDKKMINKMIPKKTIKDIVDFFKERNISKRTIYNYCLEKKNEDYRNKVIKTLLFDKFIQQTLIEKNNIKSFFMRK